MLPSESYYSWLLCLSFSLYINTVFSVQFFQNNTIPTNLTVACANAFLADVNCSTVVPYLQSGSYYPQSTLENTCTADCSSSLASYETNIVASCADATWNGYQDTEMPVVIIPDLLRYQYNLTCIMDSGRYCNVVAAQAAAALDPGSGDPVSGTSVANATGGSGSGDITDPCDLCFIRNLRFQAESPYYDGPLLADQSIYESKTSSCSVTGLPLQTTDLDFYTPTAPVTATPTCSGTSYDIKATDDCHSISNSQGIGTGWLLMDNNLPAYCAGFPSNGSLCLVNTCSVYTVTAADSCTTIADGHNITEVQLLAWNPVIDSGCYNLDNMIGYQLCVSAPGNPYTAPSDAVVVTTIATTPAPVPTDVADGVNHDCGQYYKAVVGDYCNMIIIKFGISLADFVFLNPAINVNCTNLFADESYCVQAVGDINTYSGRPGFTTGTATGTISYTQLWSTMPDATFTTPTSNATNVPLPLASDTRTDCNSYFSGALFQNSLDGTSWVSQCALVAAVYMVDLAALGIWNPSLGNTSDAGCSFNANLRYCGKLFYGTVPVADSNANTYEMSDLPTRPNMTPNCTDWADVVDGWDCQDVLDVYDLTIAQFFSYNPDVLSDCSGLWLDYQYCIRTPDWVDLRPTTTSGGSTISPTPTTTSNTGPTATAPVQSGQPVDCNLWYEAQSGDSCASVEQAYFITAAQFFAWNPSVSSDCSTGFWAGYDYCVGTVSDTSSRSTTATSVPTSTTSAAVPSPTQDNNAVSNCNKYAQAQSGDYCSLFADRNGVTLDQLYAWNQLLAATNGCDDSFWSGYYYCVGVSASRIRFS